MKRISSCPWDRLFIPSWSCSTSSCSTLTSNNVPKQQSSIFSHRPLTRPRSYTNIQYHCQRLFSTSTIRPVISSISPHKSAKLAALHARLGLSPKFPVETLARALIDQTAEPSTSRNNDPLCNIGNVLAGYYVTEHLLCTYPRLPHNVLQSSLGAYAGPKALATIGREWGVEQAYAPTTDVDPGLLQFRRLDPGQDWRPQDVGGLGRTKSRAFKNKPPRAIEEQLALGHRGVEDRKRRALAGEDVSRDEIHHPQEQHNTAIPLEFAMANFVRSTIAGVYLHEGGLPAAKKFVRNHILSRKLEIGQMFRFVQPTRELSRLCQREGFEQPVARLLAETGRNSRSPVFVVGVFSGAEKLGEGQGSSLDEARIRAAISALKGWYLYRPMMGADLPSKLDGDPTAEFKPVIIDVGEVIC